MSQRKKELGERAEKRVKSILVNSGYFVLHESKIYPDFSLLSHSDKLSDVFPKEYAVEVKTTSGYNGSDKIGKFTVSREEFNSYEEISKYKDVVLILEIRPRGYNWRNYIYFVVPWINIHNRFIKTNPDQVTLSIWWTILNGHKLRDWLNFVC